MSDLTARRLRELLDYDPKTGKFTRKVYRGGIKKVGAVNSAGYLLIRADGKKYQASRLAFLWMTGRWPTEMDHINRDRLDDRWCNLREATRSLNMHNRQLPRRDSTVPAGVTPHHNKWRAKYSVGGKTVHVGLFDTKKEAAEAYLRASEAALKRPRTLLGSRSDSQIEEENFV